ncbi:MAG: hypothetical protein JXA71_05315 [Chitinispirillaceae bacterium]|nr:hypothetical protein [Chitinispirillaceae bacterium]
MKVPVLILLLQVCFILSCLNPPRDNVFDPLNPDKGYLSGKTCTVDSTLLPGTLVKLVHKDRVTNSVTSGGDGRFEFSKADPGIYTVVAEAAYHTSVEFFPESLSAGDDDILDVYFHEMAYDFEIDNIGTAFIPGWSLPAGIWQVAEDLSDTLSHTVPHIYQGTTAGGEACCLTDKEFRDFIFRVRMKSNSGNPSMGIYFRYVDTNNYYRLLLDAAGVAFVSRVVGGTSTDLFVQSIAFDKNIWYTMTVECRDSLLTFRVTGGSLNVGTAVVDSAFTQGRLGILASQNGTVYSDDIIIRTDLTP